MTSKPILKADVQKYIKENLSTPLHKLILKGSPFPEVTVQEIAQQVDGRSRTKSKLPLWFKTDGILYPPKLNLEQSSSEQTALYKSSLLKAKTVLDATGGFGVDSFYFAQTSEEVTHIELNEELSHIAKHNFKALGATNIKTVGADALEYLQHSKKTFDVLYLDPARRSNTKARVYLLEDCTPNVVQHLDVLLNSCTHLWIKTAPMLDISMGLKALKNVISIHIIAVKNDVKEVLWHLSKNAAKEMTINTVNLGTTQPQQQFTLDEMYDAIATYDLPQKYLYEPNASLLKSGAFQWVSNHFGIDKLHANTHLYTSNTSIDFSGRRFVIQAVHPFSKRLKKELALKKAHITTRNFKLSVEALRKQLRIQDGGDVYLFFTTQLEDKPVVLVCSKI